MGLFGFGKKKEETKSWGCCRGEVKEQEKTECCCVSGEGISNIKVLGAGCRSCHEQYENVKTAVTNMGLSTEVEYITDMAKVTTYGVMTMPALVVNEKVVCMGKVLKVSEVEKLLNKQC